MFLHPWGQISLLPGPAPEGIPHRITGSSGEENKLGGEARAKLESEAGILFLFPMTFFFSPHDSNADNTDFWKVFQFQLC